MEEVRKSRIAESDLDQIWDHIAGNNIDAADNFLTDLSRSCRLLATQPKMGRSRPELALTLRSFPFQRYLVFYRPIAEGVELVRVLHSARDLGEASFNE